MLTRVKAWLVVYERLIEVAAIIILLILLGGIGGYTIGEVRFSRAIEQIRDAHIAEIDRLQAANREAISVLTQTVKELTGDVAKVAQSQGEVAGEVGRAAQTIKEAAVTAKGAAANAARAAIRQRVIPQPESEPEPNNNAEWLGGG